VPFSPPRAVEFHTDANPGLILQDDVHGLARYEDDQIADTSGVRDLEDALDRVKVFSKFELGSPKGTRLVGLGGAPD
jgi:hypothetical protein